MLMLLIWRWVGAHDAAANWTPALLAQTSPSDPSPIPDVSAWAQYGPGGILAAAVMLICWYLLRLERARSDRLEQDLRELNKQFRDQVVPLLTQFTGEATRLTQATTEAIRAMTQHQQGGR